MSEKRMLLQLCCGEVELVAEAVRAAFVKRALYLDKYPDDVSVLIERDKLGELLKRLEKA